MTTHGSGGTLSVPAAVVIVALLAAFVALAVIDSSLAIIVAIFAFVFGGDILWGFAWETDERDGGSTADDASDDHEPEIDALERLRTRYADGELTDAEFERRLEMLLETETIADVEQFLEGKSDDAEGRPTAQSDEPPAGDRDWNRDDRNLERSSE
ncbi:SHOCT domain-containing protein [Halobiforma nitratireducens]|uniref:SHOCT domain-containing protein n=1 Tax=Halobiforma nitratireducens JCM 10879 TaxID=1227454 RepID=M0LBW7_9EURY|nr:SHOCT domain-containing protein [Halobiforma nitratireducens]EMA31066.1 hypothetical protein C446_16040 [Halobiforma nitratireducens JCM 10879]